MPVPAVDVELEAMSPAMAGRVLAGTPSGDRWAPDYPLDDERDAIRHLLGQAEPPGPFGLYVVRLAPTGEAIGGIGFFGPPVDGVVEFGYGIVASRRGRGAATAAARHLLDIARSNGARVATATTSAGNGASMRVLQKAGLTAVGRWGDLVQYRLDLTDPAADRLAASPRESADPAVGPGRSGEARSMAHPASGAGPSAARSKPREVISSSRTARSATEESPPPGCCSPRAGPAQRRPSSRTHEPTEPSWRSR